MIRPASHIAQMAPYALAEMSAPPGKPLISLSQNESLRPPSTATLNAVQEVAMTGALYPDPDWTALRNALADLHGVAASNILVGAGSLDLIGCLARSYAGPTRAVLAPAHAYPFFRSAAQMANARFDHAAEINATVHVDALLAAVRPDTGIVFVANPGNPTGTRIPKSELQRLRRNLRDDVLLVIDEAYGEFADHLGERCFDMIEDEHTVVLRTFSKAYGLAGFRAGWGLFPDGIAQEIRKVMNPNNVSVVSQAAACAAVADQNYMRETVEMTAALRAHAARRLSAMGLSARQSFTNFLLIDLGDVARARAANSALQAEGIFLRAQNGAGLPTCLRLTIGAQPALNAALNHLDTFILENAP